MTQTRNVCSTERFISGLGGGALALGGLFAFACVKSVPPSNVPESEYENAKPTVCRPPRPAQ